MISVSIINQSKHPLPAYETPMSAGMDLRANLEHPEIIQPLERKLIPTGLYIELPMGTEGQVRPRSGLAIKHGITVLNSPGTIDSDYRGEIKVILINLSNEVYTVQDGDRIAQLVVSEHKRLDWIVVETISSSSRSAGGFGHTGSK